MARKEYNIDDSRLPVFTRRFRALVDSVGGVTKTSEITGLSRPTINFYYNGQRTPEADKLRMLSKTLHVSSDYLLGLSDYQSTEKSQTTVEQIGFSEKAVENLLNPVHDSFIPALNQLLENSSFESICESIISIQSAISSTPKGQEPIHNYSESIGDEYHYINDIIYFQCQDSRDSQVPIPRYPNNIDDDNDSKSFMVLYGLDMFRYRVNQITERFKSLLEDITGLDKLEFETLAELDRIKAEMFDANNSEKANLRRLFSVIYHIGARHIEEYKNGIDTQEND